MIGVGCKEREGGKQDDVAVRPGLGTGPPCQVSLHCRTRELVNFGLMSGMPSLVIISFTPKEQKDRAWFPNYS